MKQPARWYSARLEQDVDVVRWGATGTPVVVFPTAGGDAEEIERFHLVDACGELLEAGRIKIYSCDSVSGRALLQRAGTNGHLAWLQRQFIEFVRHEVVPAVRADCRDDEIEVIVGGSSIGAFNALACVCRYPDVFGSAICLSGTYDLRRFYDGDGGDLGDDFFWSSPLHFVPTLDGEHLERLRRRFVVLASGEGPNEDIGESWAVARLLGRMGIPNRVDSWGEEWPHDWTTWRVMLPRYLDDLA
jgi:esterase/lipase superfamily enzyme